MLLRVIILFSGLLVPALAWADLSASLPSAKSWPRQVQGMGLTIQYAKKDALLQVEREVLRFLQQQDVPIQVWKPTEDFLRAHLLDGPGHQGNDLDLPDIGVTRTWHYTVKMPDMQMIARLERDAQRQAQAAERQVLATQVVAGLALAMLVVLGIERWHRRKSR